MSGEGKKVPKLNEALIANGEVGSFIKLAGIYLAVILSAALVWLGVLGWVPFGSFCSDKYLALLILLPVWLCFGGGFIFFLAGSICALIGKPVKKKARWAIYLSITGFVFMVLFMWLVLVCDRAGAKLPF